MNHTPKPWKVLHVVGVSKPGPIVTNRQGQALAILSTDGVRGDTWPEVRDETEANAKLMALAPKMLEVCLELLRQNPDSASRMARCIIRELSKP